MSNNGGKRRRSRWIMWPFKAVIWFVGLSLFFVVLYRFVPPPVTLTMILDGNGITKDWTPLSNIDPNMARAAIAADSVPRSRWKRSRPSTT